MGVLNHLAQPVDAANLLREYLSFAVHKALPSAMLPA